MHSPEKLPREVKPKRVEVASANLKFPTPSPLRRSFTSSYSTPFKQTTQHASRTNATHGRETRQAILLRHKQSKHLHPIHLQLLTPSQYKKRKRNPRPDDPTADPNAPDRPESPDLETKLSNATTLYVGNLSFFTTEEQIHELFSKCGEIKRLVMGLDRFNKTPCGFCFVEYYTHQDALDCLLYIGGTKLDERIIRTDLDEGFAEGRQYGRGKSGGQVRDEYREEYDPGRGGFGKNVRDNATWANEYGPQ